MPRYKCIDTAGFSTVVVADNADAAYYKGSDILGDRVRVYLISGGLDEAVFSRKHSKKNRRFSPGAGSTSAAQRYDTRGKGAIRWGAKKRFRRSSDGFWSFDWI